MKSQPHFFKADTYYVSHCVYDTQCINGQEGAICYASFISSFVGLYYLPLTLCLCHTHTAESGNSSLSLLSAYCINYTLDAPSLAPNSSFNRVGGVSPTADMGYLDQLQALLSDSVFSQTEPPLPRAMLTAYLNKVVSKSSAGESRVSVLMSLSPSPSLRLSTCQHR